MLLKCSSCQREVTDDYVRFKCPKCNKSTIVRCADCRAKVVTYKCEECSFVGP